MTFSILVDIFYPSAGPVFSKEGVFQQPQALSQLCAFCSLDRRKGSSNLCYGDVTTSHKPCQKPIPTYRVVVNSCKELHSCR